MSFRQRYGPWAFVAGASEGLGEAFAHEAAARGLNVLLGARRKHTLEKVAGDIRSRHGVMARGMQIDLSSRGLETTMREIPDDVGLLVYNAAFAPKGEFLQEPLAAHLQAIDVNVRGPVILAHVFGERMRRRGSGGIVLVSSLSGLQGTSLISSYAATKAFELVLAEGLWNELRNEVDVIAACAGATRTPGYVSSSVRDVSHVMEPAAVAAETLDGLGSGPSIVPGWQNKLSALLMRAMPRKTAIRLISRATRAMMGR